MVVSTWCVSSTLNHYISFGDLSLLKVIGSLYKILISEQDGGNQIGTGKYRHDLAHTFLCLFSAEKVQCRCYSQNEGIAFGYERYPERVVAVFSRCWGEAVIYSVSDEARLHELSTPNSLIVPCRAIHECLQRKLLRKVVIPWVQRLRYRATSFVTSTQRSDIQSRSFTQLRRFVSVFQDEWQ